MYLYFNKSGELTTKIPHGEITRQRNPMNLWVCLDLDYFKQASDVDTNVVSVEFTKPDGTKTSPEQLLYQGEKQFFKLKDSEITYNLIPGNYYHMYHLNIDGINFNMPGDYLASINIYDTNNESNGYVQTFDFFVERTIGYDMFDITIDVDQYELLLKEIKRIGGLKRTITTELNKIYATDENGTQIALSYSNSVPSLQNSLKNTIVQRDERGKIIVSEPESLEDAANKDYVDKIIKDLIDNAPENLNTIGKIADKIKDIGVLNEEQIISLWDELKDGKYNVISEKYGIEIIIIQHADSEGNPLFKRITGSYDYIYDFESKIWKNVFAGDINLSGYLTEQEIKDLLKTKQDKLKTGYGVNISEDNVISIDDSVITGAVNTSLKNIMDGEY